MQHVVVALDNEAQAVDEVVQRLSVKFPDVPAAEILAAVNTQLAKFAGSAVRDFVPVLVEHETSEILTGRYTPDL